MVEYGVSAGEASTVVARSQGGARRDRMSHISVYSSWAPLSLAHWLQRLASKKPIFFTCAQAFCLAGPVDSVAMSSNAFFT